MQNECILSDTVDPSVVKVSIPDSQFTKWGTKIHIWCSENNVEADLITGFTKNGSWLVWKIPDPKKRTLFVLRWASAH